MPVGSLPPINHPHAKLKIVDSYVSVNIPHSRATFVQRQNDSSVHTVDTACTRSLRVYHVSKNIWRLQDSQPAYTVCRHANYGKLVIIQGTRCSRYTCWGWTYRGWLYSLSRPWRVHTAHWSIEFSAIHNSVLPG